MARILFTIWHLKTMLVYIYLYGSVKKSFFFHFKYSMLLYTIMRPLFSVLCFFFAYILQVKYVDVVCFNRYYSWYGDSGHLDLISFQLERELKLWHNITGKLLIMTEYGADAVAGIYQVRPVCRSNAFDIVISSKV